LLAFAFFLAIVSPLAQGLQGLGSFGAEAEKRRRKMDTTNEAGFRVGDRVQLHPCTNSWMRGDRFGDVVRAGRLACTVKLDKSGRTSTFRNELLLPVED
jgi:hypothetical protein